MSIGTAVTILMWFSLWALYPWLLIALLADVVKRPDVTGWAKTGWVLLIVVAPYLGSLAYLKAQRISGYLAGQGGGDGAAAEIDTRSRLPTPGAINETGSAHR